MTTFEIVKIATEHANVGDLLITLDAEHKEEFAELVSESHETDQQIFIQLIEVQLCNGYHLVQPEHIGALTSSLIIADEIIDDETPADAVVNIWWFPNYAVKSYTEDLVSKGFVVFTKAESH